MTQISKVDLIVQQLENLSLAELQEIKSKVDDLIENRSEANDVESFQVFQGTFLVKGDAPVKNIIDLVNDWMCDESEYDEETYPQIEVALNQS